MPEHFTVDSIILDLQQSPKAMQMLGPIMKQIMDGMGLGAEQSDDSSGAVTADMASAMMRYMPLRSIASFSGGMITYEQLEVMVDMINQK